MNEILLNDIQEEKYKEVLCDLIKNEQLSSKLQKYFTNEEIVQYVKEGLQFYSEEIKDVTILLSNDMDMYTNILRVSKNGLVSTFNVYTIASFNKYREDFYNIKVGYRSISEMVGREFSLVNPSLIKLDELVYTILFTQGLTGLKTKKELYIVFYVKERGTI